MSDASRFDPQLGYVPAIPEPFWITRWFRTKPQCYICKIVLRNRSEWETHYVLNHLESEDRDDQE